jgi:hypothetical protein
LFQDADIEDDCDEEDDEDEEDEEDEEEEDADELEDGEIAPPPAKAARTAPPPYELPTVTSLKAAAREVLAPHLNIARPNGEPAQCIKPFVAPRGEHFCTLVVTHDD